jgi:hypothetical protein
MRIGIALLAGLTAFSGLLLAAPPAAAGDRGWGRGHQHHQYYHHHRRHDHHRYPGHWVHPQFGPSYYAPVPRWRPPPVYYAPPPAYYPGYDRPRGGVRLGVQVPLW